MTIRRHQQSQFGTKLFALRQQLFLSREQVAERSNISAHLLQSLEQGRTCNPTVTTLLGLARALSVSVADLIEWITPDLEAEKSTPTGDERENTLSGLSRSQKPQRQLMKER